MGLSVADLLAHRGIPFVFVTGCGTDGLDDRLARTPVFERPLEPRALESIFGGARAMPRARDAALWSLASRAG